MQDDNVFFMKVVKLWVAFFYHQVGIENERKDESLVQEIKIQHGLLAHFEYVVSVVHCGDKFIKCVHGRLQYEDPTIEKALSSHAFSNKIVHWNLLRRRIVQAHGERVVC